jgi:hypothetical protein
MILREKILVELLIHSLEEEFLAHSLEMLTPNILFKGKLRTKTAIVPPKPSQFFSQRKNPPSASHK